ncbi:MAG: transcription antitermination factor NusB [Gemmatimonadetes bacterium]|nr:transcription antitermination factor NusB [Gemmatimonadota bacterium]
MGVRRKARELALKLLYRIDLTGDSWEALAGSIQEEYGGSVDSRSFASTLVSAVLENQTRIDAILRASAVKWDLARMANLDRNVLRLALCEYLVLESAPGPVILDEAIAIATRYSTEKSGSFVNGVLDPIFKKYAPGFLAAPDAPDNTEATPRTDEAS